MRRYWLYKNNTFGGPSGYWGDWISDVFSEDRENQWGGSYSTRSPEVLNYLDDDVAAGDVIVAYQTDTKAVVGFCVVTKITGPVGDRKIYLRPIAVLNEPFLIHQHKHGTVLAKSAAVNGPVMLRELSKEEMEVLVDLSSAPRRVLQGKASAKGFIPALVDAD